MTVANVISQLQTVVRGISGIKAAPNEPPESMAVFPFAVAYSAGGNYGGSAHAHRLEYGTHDLVVEIHVQRKDLPRSVAQAMPYLERFRDAIQDNPTLNSTVKSISSFEYSFGALPAYGGIETLGFEFRLTVTVAG